MCYTLSAGTRRLYPLTLYLSDICRSSPLLSFSKRGGDISATRNFFSFLKTWASDACAKERKTAKGACCFHTLSTHDKNFFVNVGARVSLAKSYLREGLTLYQRWHNKMGHIGAKRLRRCQIPGLTVPKQPFRCESCIIGKMHALGHSQTSTSTWSTYSPGDLRQPRGGTIQSNFSRRCV